MFTHTLLCVLVAAASAQTTLPVASDSHTDCGSRYIRELTVDGETVKSDQPWFIVISYKWEPTRTDYETTGTLISTKHVVTDAWGVTYDKNTAYPASRMRLSAGSHLRYHSPEPSSQSRGVTSLHVHEQLDRTRLVNNIALVVADQPFVMSWDVNIACVDWSGVLEALQPYQHVLASGWRHGFNSSNRAYSSQPAAIGTHHQCQTSAKRSERAYFSADSLCVRTTSKDTCKSVPGGGLLVEQPTGRGDRFFLVALWSRDLDWNMEEYCTVGLLCSYTNVTSQLTWIKRHVDLA